MKIIAGSSRGTVLLWGAITECVLGGALMLLQISPTVAEALGWGRWGSTVALGAAMVCTLAGMVAAARIGSLSRGAVLTTTVLLALAAAATAVLALSTLAGSTGTGAGLLVLLALGVFGMVLIVVELLRTAGRSRPVDPMRKAGA